MRNFIETFGDDKRRTIEIVTPIAGRQSILELVGVKSNRSCERIPDLRHDKMAYDVKINTDTMLAFCRSNRSINRRYWVIDLLAFI